MVAYDLVLPFEAVHVGVPSTAATVIIAVDEPLDVGWLDEPDRSLSSWCSISGLHLRPALVRTFGLPRGIHLSVTPLGCRALFGAPIGAVAGYTIDMAELPRGLPTAEHDAIVSCASWADRLATLEGLLLARLESQALAPDVTAAWDLLGRGVQVAQVAGEVGWSRRHLGNRVRAEFGVSPKEIGRLARFERARRLVDGGVTLADAAHTCEFADQSHLSREWRGFAGRSPTASTEEFPNLHDLITVDGQD